MPDIRADRLLEQARRPTYDGTETTAWSDVPKTLTFWADALGFRGVETTGDLTEEQKQNVAQHTLLGDPEAETWGELRFFPVVNPDTGALNRNALVAVLSGRGEQADISDSQLESAQTVAQNLLDEEFDEDDRTGSAKETKREMATTDEQAREVSLSDMIRAIHQQFYAEHDDIENDVEYFVQEVFQEDLIAYAVHEDTLYRIGYEATVDEESVSVTFDEDSEWVAVEETYVPVDDERQRMEDRKEHMRPTAEENIEEIEKAKDELLGVWDRGAPAIKKSAPDSYARHCRRRGSTYFRDFAAWDGPSPKMTRSKDESRVTVTINSRSEDRHGTIILPRGARLGRYNEENPIVLINHSHDLPAGTSSVSVRDGEEPSLQADMEDANWDLSDPSIERWFNKITRDPPIVRSASIGALFHEVVPGRDFDGIDEIIDTDAREVRDLPDVVTDWTLVEWSWVSVPSNPDATIGRSEIDRVRREAEAQIRKVQETVTESVPSPSGRSASDEAEPPESSDEDESEGARPRRLSDIEAKTLAQDAAQDAIDRATGRK